jgi:beta-glucosidase
LSAIASFDRKAFHEFGKAMGGEQRAKGTGVMLGPMVNLARVPLDGRAFESTGEDPILSSKMIAPLIKGIQANNVAANVKHLAFNNQELNRTLTSANVDQRTAQEIYYRPFRAAVDAGVLSAMCSYNRINNTYACQHEGSLSMLKEGWEGFIMSDWVFKMMCYCY